MCDERERLNGYLNGETSRAERQEVELHLADCHVCRAEIGGLRGVREDLLAWDVPAHEPVWRPVAPAPPVPFWRAVPSWGLLAAAASLIFTAGAAGGVASRMWFPAPQAAVSSTQAAATAQPMGITPAELARLEASLLSRVRGEMDRRIETVSLESLRPSQMPQAVADPPSAEQVTDLRRQLAELQQWRSNQVMVTLDLHRQIGRLANTTTSINDDLEFSRLQRVSSTNFGGTR
jgi:hypothetical protein